LFVQVAFPPRRDTLRVLAEKLRVSPATSLIGAVSQRDGLTDSGIRTELKLLGLDQFRNRAEH
jgi:hypothetical protein